jgi:sortase A
MRRRTTIGAGVVAVVVALAGCGGGDEPSDARARSAPAASTPATTSTSDRDGVRPTPGPAADPGSAAGVADAATSQPTLPPVAPPPPAAAPAAPALRTPIPAPVDENAAEPVIELGSIEIPKLGIDETLYEGIRLPTFDLGPGHWPGTAMPGEFGNAVVGGHRTSMSKPFRYLDRLVPGDDVVFNTDAGRFLYRVTSTEIVDPYEMRVVNQNPGFSATLFACHPVGSTKERIVVHLTLVTP